MIAKNAAVALQQRGIATFMAPASNGEAQRGTASETSAARSKQPQVCYESPAVNLACCASHTRAWQRRTPAGDSVRVDPPQSGEGTQGGQQPAEVCNEG